MLSAEGPGANTNQTDPVHAQTTEYGPSDFDAPQSIYRQRAVDPAYLPAQQGLSAQPSWWLAAWWHPAGLFRFSMDARHRYQQSIAPVTSAATIAPTRPVAYFQNAGMNYGNQCFITSAISAERPPSPISSAPTISTSPMPDLPDIGRNSFRGPGYFSTDASLAKRFSLLFWVKPAAIELRGYAFNVFNQLNLIPFLFGDVDTHVENPNFGRPAGALAGRSIELQVRLTF